MSTNAETAFLAASYARGSLADAKARAETYYDWLQSLPNNVDLGQAQAALTASAVHYAIFGSAVPDVLDRAQGVLDQIAVHPPGNATVDAAVSASAAVAFIGSIVDGFQNNSAGLVALPSGSAVDDYAVVWMSGFEGYYGVAMPTGWTKLQETSGVAGPNTGHCTLWGKKLVADDLNPPSFTISNQGDAYTVGVRVYRHVDATAVQSAITHYDNLATGGYNATPSLSAPAKSMAVGLWGFESNANSTTSIDTGDNQDGGTKTLNAQCSADYTFTSAGTAGPYDAELARASAASSALVVLPAAA